MTPRTWLLPAALVVTLITGIVAWHTSSKSTAGATTPVVDETSRSGGNSEPAAFQAAAPANISPSGKETPSPNASDWMTRWKRLLATPASPEQHREICAMLEELAARDPAQALMLARQENDAELRRERLTAVLEGWATVNMAAAARWTLSQNELYPDIGLAAVFNGARARPDEAIHFARQLSHEQPQRAASIGSYLIFGLGRADEHQKAVQFALEGRPEIMRDWLTAAYDQWGRKQPEEALSSAQNLSDPEKRQVAFHAAVSGWARVDPRKLVEKAETLPAGSERNFAMITALRAWVQRDPEATADYIARAGSIPGVEAVLED